MNLNEKIEKLEEALKLAKQKQKDEMLKKNQKFSAILFKKLSTSEVFKDELLQILNKYNLEEAIKLIKINTTQNKGENNNE